MKWSPFWKRNIGPYWTKFGIQWWVQSALFSRSSHPWGHQASLVSRSNSENKWEKERQSTAQKTSLFDWTCRRRRKIQTPKTSKRQVRVQGRRSWCRRRNTTWNKRIRERDIPIIYHRWRYAILSSECVQLFNFATSKSCDIGLTWLLRVGVSTANTISSLSCPTTSTRSH